RPRRRRRVAVLQRNVGDAAGHEDSGPDQQRLLAAAALFLRRGVGVDLHGAKRSLGVGCERDAHAARLARLEAEQAAVVQVAVLDEPDAMVARAHVRDLERRDAARLAVYEYRCA